MDGMKTLLTVHLTVGRTPFKTPTKGRKDHMEFKPNKGPRRRADASLISDVHARMIDRVKPAGKARWMTAEEAIASAKGAG